MKSTKISLALLLLLVISAVSTPVGMDMTAEISEPIDGTQVSQAGISGYISDVPYVWQEVNGYCMSAALSMVLQGMSLDLSMHDLFTTMGTGFSALYIGIAETRGFYPGVFIRQPAYFQFFSDLYGLELTTYFDSREAFGSDLPERYDMRGLEFTDYSNTSSAVTPFKVLRDSIDAGIPLAIAADILYLPPEDYDPFRPYIEPLEAGGVGHAITIVGYNETAQEVYIQDPGIGLWGPDYGYPDDGSWNYTMSYVDFNRSWQSAGYFTLHLTPGSGPVEDFDERLGEYICRRLRGDRTAYFEGAENLYFFSPGKDAFSGIALDLTVQCISDYAKYYTEARKAEGLLILGHSLESMLTTHYHSYRNALKTISDILPQVDLTNFIDAADDALPHLDALSHNASITGGISLILRDSLLFSTFEEIALDFDSTGNLDGSIAAHQEQLDEIREHLFAVANSWDAAADALEEALNLQNDGQPTEISLPILIGGSGVLILAVAFFLVKRRR